MSNEKELLLPGPDSGNAEDDNREQFSHDDQSDSHCLTFWKNVGFWCLAFSPIYMTGILSVIVVTTIYMSGENDSLSNTTMPNMTLGNKTFF